MDLGMRMSFKKRVWRRTRSVTRVTTRAASAFTVVALRMVLRSAVMALRGLGLLIKGLGSPHPGGHGCFLVLGLGPAATFRRCRRGDDPSIAAVVPRHLAARTL